MRVLAGTELGQAVQERISGELPDAEDVDWDPADRAAFGKLAEEVAWLTVDPAQDEDDPPEDDADLLAGPERPLLEALLRQFEYEADLLAVEGKAGIDTAWLREQLKMTDELVG